MSDQNKSVARKKLSVISIESEKTWGEHNVPVLKFKGNDGEKEFTYEIFGKKELIETVKTSVGAVLECEVETSQRERDGNTYTDRKVLQVFVGGEPVVRKNAFQGRGRTPEEIASIETQCAYKIISTLRIADKIGEDSLLYKNLVRWLEIKTGASVVQSPNPSTADKEFEKLGRTDSEKPATNAQLTAIENAVTKDCFPLKEFIAKHKDWTAKSSKELTVAQANEMLKEYKEWKAKKSIPVS